MTTIGRNHQSSLRCHDPNESRAPLSNLDTDTFDPDEVFPSSTPPMKPLLPKLEPSPSPPPEIVQPRALLSPHLKGRRLKSNRRKSGPSSGDTVLISYLDNGRHPDIARAAGVRALPTESDEEDDDDHDHEYDDYDHQDRRNDDHEVYDDHDDYDEYPSNDSKIHDQYGSNKNPEHSSRGIQVVTNSGSAYHRDAAPALPPVITTSPRLQHLAADALQVFAADPRPGVKGATALDISASTRQLSISDMRPHFVPPSAVSPPGRQASHYRSVADGTSPHQRTTPHAITRPPGGELPPLQIGSPFAETNDISLPPIRSALGDEFRTHAETDWSTRHATAAVFPGSPPSSRVACPLSLSGSHISPPISPNEAYHRTLPSPRSQPASSPYHYLPNGVGNGSYAAYSRSATGETPSSTEQSASTPATTDISTPVADPMSIDGMTNPQCGAYVCQVPGCTAAAFQTQYLLNSHANVHSSVRSHYCPVSSCSRSEGGKGFKRKNEMIRHRLVHESPGYVCPFCPDREHKYPRPDNLQRHVRVHHVDRDKNDPLLRDVLSQRPDGPNRGRRRRGP